MIDCKAGERKHQIAEEYLAGHKPGTGVFLIVSRAPATVWKVSRSAAGVIHRLEKTRQFVNHHSFHIIDPTWGHVTIKLSGHPPFGAQVILNGHEYVACAARSAGVGYLVFASGAVMDRLFNTVVDRTRSRLDVPKVRTLFGSKGRPHRNPVRSYRSDKRSRSRNLGGTSPSSKSTPDY